MRRTGWKGFRHLKSILRHGKAAFLLSPLFSIKRSRLARSLSFLYARDAYQGLTRHGNYRRQARQGVFCSSYFFFFFLSLSLTYFRLGFVPYILVSTSVTSRCVDQEGCVKERDRSVFIQTEGSGKKRQRWDLVSYWTASKGQKLGREKDIQEW